MLICENSGLKLTEAIKRAVENCIKNNILREFLQKYGGDVVSILSREWNLDDAKRVWREETAEEIAENLIKLGISIKKIIESTGLPREKVEQIAQTYNKNK